MKQMMRYDLETLIKQLAFASVAKIQLFKPLVLKVQNLYMLI